MYTGAGVSAGLLLCGSAAGVVRGCPGLPVWFALWFGLWFGLGLPSGLECKPLGQTEGKPARMRQPTHASPRRPRGRSTSPPCLPANQTNPSAQRAAGSPRGENQVFWFALDAPHAVYPVCPPRFGLRTVPARAAGQPCLSEPMTTMLVRAHYNKGVGEKNEKQRMGMRCRNEEAAPEGPPGGPERSEPA